MRIPLRLGAMAIAGHGAFRSGLRWLREDGQMCRAGEVVAYCNIAIRPEIKGALSDFPFFTERRDFQIALTSPVAGRIHHAPGTSKGGFFDQMNLIRWQKGFVIGHIEAAASLAPGGGGLEVGLLMMTGLRTTELAEVRSGLLTGWHERARAWRLSGKGPIGTVLSMGTCELEGVIKGERSGFLEIFEAIPGDAQIVFVPDPPLVPNSRFLAEQMARSPEQNAEIARDMTMGLVNGAVPPTPGDWVFAGAFLMGMQRSPLRDRYDLLSRSGLSETGPADAVILSLNAEATQILRHRRLGYSLWIHKWRLSECGKALSDWVGAQFEMVTRSLEDIEQDYRQLIAQIRQNVPGAQILVLNTMSSSAYEDIQNYAAFDAPLGATLSSVHAKDLNLMLYALERECGIAVVDVDAIAAEFGEREHLHVGVHQSGEVQAEIRAEILRILDARGVSGFTRRREALGALAAGA